MYRGHCNKIILLFVFFISSLGKSQDFKKVNELTLQFYQEEKWDSLIIVGNSSINSGLDFYYLRLRMGLAHYFKQEYFLAIPHFKKAIEMNEAEDVAVEYLYYCYFLTQQYNQALNTIHKQTIYLQNKVGYNAKNYVPSIGVRRGYKFSNLDLIPLLHEIDFDLNLTLLKKINWKMSFNNINQNNNEWGIHQKQYYTNLTLPFKRNWNISSGFSWMDYTYKETYNNKSISDQMYAIGFDIDKIWKNHHFGIGYGNLFGNSTSQQQIHAKYILYPNGNTNFFVGTELFLSTNNWSNYYFAFKPTLGIKISSKLYLNGSYLKGGGQNLLQENVEIINNNYHITSSIFENGFRYKITPKYSLGLFYQHEAKVWSEYSNYHYNSLFINLKFTP